MAIHLECDSTGEDHAWLADAGVPDMWWCSKCGLRTKCRHDHISPYNPYTGYFYCLDCNAEIDT